MNLAPKLVHAATIADLEALPRTWRGEIIDGTLYAFPRPRFEHANIESFLSADLKNPFQRGRGGPGGWVLLDEPELHLGGDDVLVPDLAGWRRERMPRLPEAAFIALAPDWVCEVLSPSTEAIDRTDKLPIYAREEVRHAWLVDPLVQTLEVLRLEASAWRVAGTWRGEAKVRAEPFAAFELDLALLWAR